MTWQDIEYDPDEMLIRESEEPFRVIAELVDNELTNKQTHLWGQLLAKARDMRHALTLLADLIESTYEHDDNGNRTNGDNPLSGADVCEELCGLESVVFGALDRLPGLDVDEDKEQS